MLLIKLAWRNLFRNKRRTFIAGTAIGLGLAALIFIDALMIGMVDNYIHNATASFMGEAQILREGFRETSEVELTITDFVGTIARLEEEPIVERFAPRTSTFGTITSAANMSAVNIFGIDPDRERHISIVDEAVFEGDYFDGENARDILIGEKLADVLEAGLGDRLVLTVTQVGSGDIAQELFRISGIFDMGDRTMNGNVAFVRIDKARELLNIGETAHMIAIKFTDPKLSNDPTLMFWEKFSAGENEAVSWREIFPQLVSMFELTDLSRFVMSFILMGVVVFVILNTLFMSLYERMFEFGVLKAVGTRPFAVAKLVMFEALALSIISIAIGCVIGFAITMFVAWVGIDYSGIEAIGITVREKIYPVLTVRQFVVYSIGVLIFTVVIGIYPAVHAARLVPAKAMRKSI